MSKRIDKACEHCGSTAVSIEGCIRWNADEQEYAVTGICDKGHTCDVCGREGRLIDVEIVKTPTDE